MSKEKDRRNLRRLWARMQIACLARAAVTGKKVDDQLRWEEFDLIATGGPQYEPEVAEKLRKKESEG